jgi:hypothetical protein
VNLQANIEFVLNFRGNDSNNKHLYPVPGSVLVDWLSVAIICLHNISLLAFIMEEQYVIYEVRTEALNILIHVLGTS